MASAVRSLADLDQQTENRNLRATYSDHLRLTLADVKTLEKFGAHRLRSFPPALEPIHRLSPSRIWPRLRSLPQK